MNIDPAVIWDNAALLSDGFLFTLKLSSAAIVGGFLLGLPLALARHSKWALPRIAAGLYVDLMRSVPLLLALFWIFFLAPMMLQWATGAARPVKVGPDKTAISAFILFEAAYYCEIIRAGIRSVARGQGAAALALGMTRLQTLRFVILPQALRSMVPVFLTQAIILFQDTSLVYVMSVTDFLGAASIIGIRDGDLTTPYLFVTIVYLVVSVMLSSAVYYFSKHSKVATATVNH